MKKTKGIRRSIAITMISISLITASLGTGTNRGWYYNYPDTYSGRDVQAI